MKESNFEQKCEAVMYHLKGGKLTREALMGETGFSGGETASILNTLKTTDKVRRFKEPDAKGFEDTYYQLTSKGMALALYLAPPLKETSTTISNVSPPDELRSMPALLKTWKALAERPSSTNDLADRLGITEKAASVSIYKLRQKGLAQSRAPKGIEVDVHGRAYAPRTKICDAMKDGKVVSNNSTEPSSNVTKLETKKPAASSDWQDFVDQAPPHEIPNMILACMDRFEREYSKLEEVTKAIAIAHRALPAEMRALNV